MIKNTYTKTSNRDNGLTVWGVCILIGYSIRVVRLQKTFGKLIVSPKNSKFTNEHSAP
jgi:hypothetical protein